MGVCVSGVKVAGFSVGGKPVAGLAANGIVIWRRPSAEDTELIVNGGFEDGTNGWKIVGAGQVITSDITPPRAPYEGSSYFKSTKNNSGIQQRVVVDPGTTYYISFAYGCAASGRVCECLLTNGDTGDVLLSKKTGSTKVGWNLVEFDYTIPNKVTTLVFRLSENAWGRFDAVSMKKQGRIAVPASLNVLEDSQ